MNNRKEADIVEQPLMSTGTTEPSFVKGREESQLVSPPRIGEVVVGDQEAQKSNK